MKKAYKLYNKIKHYEWGSMNLLPEFLGIENTGRVPSAEMWMGTHSGAPSQIEIESGLGGAFNNKSSIVNLSEISGELPFLFKLLAVEKPLSIQAHPNKQQALEGFERENSEGLDSKAPTRNYKDPNQKHEIICALSPFTLMAGFREPDVILEYFREIITLVPQLKELFFHLISALEKKSLCDFFIKLFSFSRLEREYIFSFLSNRESGITGCKTSDEEFQSTGVISQEQWKLMKSFSRYYPGDPAILSPLYLNLLTLNPSDAVYIPAGVMHAYLSGFGIELMNSSDNVLRGGLTPKYTDIGELKNIVLFEPFKPEILYAGDELSSFQKNIALLFKYKTPCEDFLLVRMKDDSVKEKTSPESERSQVPITMEAYNKNIFPVSGPAICIVTEGELTVNGDKFTKGDSFFIPQAQEPFIFDGNYTLYAACLNDL